MLKLTLARGTDKAKLARDLGLLSVLELEAFLQD
jgi:hypothetical protein